MKRDKVEWTCPACGHKHRWSWPKHDAFRGEIRMECDKCPKRSNMRMRERWDGVWVAE